MNAVCYIATKAATKLISYLGRFSGNMREDISYHPLYIGTPLLEVTNDGWYVQKFHSQAES